MKGDTRRLENIKGKQIQDRNVRRYRGKQTHVPQRQVSSWNQEVLMVGTGDDSKKHEKKSRLGGQIRRGENR
jgi:hypothetical protein